MVIHGCRSFCSSKAASTVHDQEQRREEAQVLTELAHEVVEEEGDQSVVEGEEEETPSTEKNKELANARTSGTRTWQIEHFQRQV